MNKYIKRKKRMKILIKSELKRLRNEHQKYSYGSCGIHRVEYNLKLDEVQYYDWSCGTSNTKWIKSRKIYPARKTEWIEVT